MKKENINQPTYFPSPLAGEGARRAGEGYQKICNNAPLIRAAAHLPPPRGKALRQVSPDLHLMFPRGGFTLIELLVVVLIIGILAAVAVPQYQKAVEKSKAAQALTMLKTVYNAAAAYYLANGTHATSFDELSIDVPWTGHSGWYGGSLQSQIRSNADWSVELYQAPNGAYPAVAVGRLRGKYAGAAFIIYLHSTSSKSIPTRTPVCVERIVYGKNFTAEDGSYCQKIFKGTLVSTTSMRYYTLP